jgi:L-malate glycosyltransferase
MAAPGAMTPDDLAAAAPPAGGLPRTLLVGNFLSRHLATPTVGEELAARLAAAGWPVTWTSDQRPRLVRLIDMQRTIWTRGPFAVAQVDVYSGAAFLWAEMAAWSLRRQRTPYLLTLHGGRLPAFARRWPWRVRRLLARARVVTTPSPYLSRAMTPYRADLRVVPNPLDLSAYRFALRRQPRPRLVWLRAFHHIYNPQLAPRVLARLVSAHPEARLTMAGPDKGDGSLAQTRRVAADLGVADRITYTGWVPKHGVPELLAGADVFLNTANADNAPVSVTEAMACGLCVVSTDAGGLPDLIKGGEDGLLVGRDDAEAMAAAVGRVLGDVDLAVRLSAGARLAAEARDWSSVLPAWQRLLIDNARGQG